MKNAMSHDLGFSLRETRVRKMDKRDIGIGEWRGARRATAHKSEWWRRNIATKDSILAGNGQRNNAESIEVGLATPFGFVVAMLSVRRGSNTSARLNVIFSRKTDPQILQPPLYPPLRFSIPLLLGIRHGRQGPFCGDSIFLFFTAFSMSSLVLFPQTRATRRVQCDPAEGCEELLTFHCEHWICGSSRRNCQRRLLLTLSLFHPFRSADKW